MDSLWFAPISKIDSVRNGKDADDCRHVILTGVHYMTGHFLEKSTQSTTSQK